MLQYMENKLSLKYNDLKYFFKVILTLSIEQNGTTRVTK